MGRLSSTMIWIGLAASTVTVAATLASPSNAQDEQAVTADEAIEGVPVPAEPPAPPAGGTAPPTVQATTGVLPVDALTEARRLLALPGADRNPERAALILEEAATAGVAAVVVPLADLYRTGDGVAEDDTRAEQLYQQALAAGNVRDAAFGLGLLYRRGTLRDPEKAIASFESASAAGNVAAAFQLGEIYRTGDGVRSNADTAKRWYEVAVSSGDERDATYGLGLVLRAGRLQDGPAALAYFQRALAAGNQESLVAIGRMYRRAEGIPGDPVKAKDFYERALIAGFQGEAAYGLGVLYRRGPLRDPKLAVGYYGLAAAVGNDAALIELGEMYRLGDGVPQDPDKAKGYYEQAIAAGNTRDSSYGLALLYRSGPLRDPAEAVHYFEDAIDAGLDEALVDLADMYRTGDGIDADPEKAQALYQEALDAGEVAGAAYGLGQLYRAGPLADADKALASLTRAAEAGNLQALVALGDMYRLGDGVAADAGQAKSYYERAVLAGAGDTAGYGLGTLYREGPLRDPAVAVGYFEVAAGAGSGPAMVALGDMYRLGDGVAADPARAAGLYNQALDAGEDGGGHYGLGALALQPGDRRDPVTAREEFQTAADAGYRPALAALGEIYRTGDGVDVDLGRAADLFQRALDAGAERDGALGLARLYASGPDRDAGKAVQYYERARGAGSVEAMVALGDIWRTGDGVAPDTRKARAAYEEALAAGAERDASYGLGMLYRPSGGLRDPQRAVEYLTRAVQAGSLPALVALGDVYRTGEGIAADPASAVFLYEQAIAGGDEAGGAYGLGALYREEGPLYDPGAAEGYFERAANAGNPQAQLALAVADAANLAAASRRDRMLARFRAAAGSLGTRPVADAILAQPSRTVASIVQTLLAANGFDPGPIDGAPGRRTATAVDGFCAAAQLSGCTNAPPFSRSLIQALVEKAPA